MNVRAKFRCTRVTHHETYSPTDVCAEVVLAPVYGTQDRPDNAEWSKATPQGEIKMTITNPTAIEAFSPGKSFFVDFTPAE